jgi:hypothetical protein
MSQFISRIKMRLPAVALRQVDDRGFIRFEIKASEGGNTRFRESGLL